MNKFLLLVEQTLNEAVYERNSIINRPFRLGGLPDMSSTDNQGWETVSKLSYKRAYEPYAIVAPQQQMIFFVKRPTSMNLSAFKDKVDAYMEFRGIYKNYFEKSLPAKTVDLFDKHTVDFATYQKVTGEDPNDWVELRKEENGSFKKPVKKTLTREEGMAEIKAKAKALAMELRDTLISNGVSKENAVMAAKDAYHRFVQDFYNKSNLKTAAAGGPVKAMDNPLMHRGVHDRLKAADENKIKQKAAQLYKDLLRAGTPEPEAKLRARKYYERLINPPAKGK